MRARSLIPLIALALPAVLRAQTNPTTPQSRVLINEILLPQGPGAPGYIELLRTDLQPGPVNLGGVTLQVFNALGTTVFSTTFSSAAFLPQNSSALPSVTALVANQPLGTPAAVEQLVSFPPAVAAGAPLAFCLGGPGGIIDAVIVGPPPATIPPCFSPGINAFFGNLPTGSPNGYSRFSYTDTDTSLDFRTDFPPTPGLSNAYQRHPNGVILAQGPAASITLNANGTFSGVTTVAAVDYDPASGGLSVAPISNPAYDGIIGGQAQIAGTFSGQDLAFLTDVTILTETLTITSAQNPAHLITFPFTFTPGSSMQGTAYSQSPTNPGRLRVDIQRTDGIPDSPPAGGGGGETRIMQNFLGGGGGGNLWCEVWVVDENGITYKAQVKNWPPLSGGTPICGASTDGAGSFDLVVVNFPPGAEIYNLATLTVSTPTGSGPFFGLALTAEIFTEIALPLPTPPFHVTTTPQGFYVFGLPTGTVPTGISMDIVTIEWIPGTGVGQTCAAHTITF